jgi:phosphate transport system substrate-binding protein
MRDSEFKAAADNGIQPVAHVVALDGLPILVHPQNPIAELTIEQIRKIYTGEITNWKDVGGPDLGIVVITRDTNSGTYETFEGMVMNKQKITEKAEYVGSNGAIRSS